MSITKLGIRMRIFASRQSYARASYAGAGEARVARVTFDVGSEKLFGVCSIQAAVAPLRPRPPSPSRQRTPSSAIYLSRAYLNVSDCVTHIWPIPMVCNDIPHDIPERDPPGTYVRTYVLCENRSSIQSLTLMRSAITRAIKLA